jgi:hypothetical protein
VLKTTIPDVPTGFGLDMEQFLLSLKEIAEAREGMRGPEEDRFITLADIRNLSEIGVSGDTIPTPFTDADPISPPTNMLVAPGTWVNKITWLNTKDPHLAGVEIWHNTVTSVTEATRIAVVGRSTSQYIHTVDYVTLDNYYWIRSISYAGRYSTWVPTLEQGGYYVPARDTLGQRIDGVLDALLGATPDLYDPLVVYEYKDHVRWTAADGVTRRYRRTNYNLGVSGFAPSNTLYWDRVGILVEGEIDGQPTVGINGNLVVDKTILARSIETSGLVVGDGSGSTILMGNGVIEVKHVSTADASRLVNDLSQSTGENLFYDPSFINQISGSNYWVLSGLAGERVHFGNTLGEDGTPGAKFDVVNGMYTYVHTRPHIVCKTGDEFYMLVRCFISTDFNASRLFPQLMVHDYTGDNIIQFKSAGDVPLTVRNQWITHKVKVQVTVTGAASMQVMPLQCLTDGTAGYFKISYCYISKAEPGATVGAEWGWNIKKQPVLPALVETYEFSDALDKWQRYYGPQDEITIEQVSDSITGGRILRVGNNSGNDHALLVHRQLIPFDPELTYKLKFRVRRTAGTGTVYLGVWGVGADGVTLVNVNGLNDTGNHYYSAGANAAPGSSWTEFVGYIKGAGTPTQEARPLITNPAQLHSNVRYMRLGLIANYNGAAGITEVDVASIEILTGEVLWNGITGPGTPEDSATNDAPWRHSSDITKIDGGKIYTSTIVANAIAAGQITANHVGTNQIIANSGNIGNALLVTDHYSNLSVTEGKIGNLAVSTLKIQNNAVTVPVFSYIAGPSGHELSYSTWYTVATIGLETYGQPVMVLLSIRLVKRILKDWAVKVFELQIQDAGTLDVLKSCKMPSVWWEPVDEYYELRASHFNVLFHQQNPPSPAQYRIRAYLAKKSGTEAEWAEDSSTFAIGLKK